MKVIGVILVLLASWGFGSGLIQRLNQHREQLFSLGEMIDLFLGEIQYGKLPLQEACLHISYRMKSPFKEILCSIGERISEKRYESFEVVWQEQFQKQKKEFFLTESEKHVLYGVGSQLGYLDIDAQIRHLQLYRKEVHNLLKQLEK